MMTNNLEKFPKRVAGKQTWQYTAWLRLTAGLKAEGISSEHSIGIRTAKGKFVHSDLLDYQKFYPLISHIRGLTDIKDAVLVHDFFNDGFINSDNLFYLPKRLVQTYQELKVLNSLKSTSGSYYLTGKNLSGTKVYLGAFKTLEEAQEVSFKHKASVLRELFNIYQGFLPAHFCDRFKAEVLNCDLR